MILLSVAYAFCGALVGGISCVLVNDVLLSVSMTPGVSCLVGLMLFSMAVLISCRANLHRSKRPEHRCFVLSFALWVLLAAVFCMLLDKQWVHFLTAKEKVPLYCVVGVALQVVFTFSFLDLFSVALRFLSGAGERGYHRVIRSPSQVCLVLVVSVTLGFLFGSIFGIYDVEDDAHWLRWYKDKRVTFPVGMAGGAIAGFGVRACPGHQKGDRNKRGDGGYVRMPVESAGSAVL